MGLPATIWDSLGPLWTPYEPHLAVASGYSMLRLRPTFALERGWLHTMSLLPLVRSPYSVATGQGCPRVAGRALFRATSFRRTAWDHERVQTDGRGRTDAAPRALRVRGTVIARPRPRAPARSAVFAWRERTNPLPPLAPQPRCESRAGRRRTYPHTGHSHRFGASPLPRRLSLTDGSTDRTDSQSLPRRDERGHARTRLPAAAAAEHSYS